MPNYPGRLRPDAGAVHGWAVLGRERLTWTDMDPLTLLTASANRFHRRLNVPLSRVRHWTPSRRPIARERFTTRMYQLPGTAKIKRQLWKTCARLLCFSFQMMQPESHSYQLPVC